MDQGHPHLFNVCDIWCVCSLGEGGGEGVERARVRKRGRDRQREIDRERKRERVQVHVYYMHLRACMLLACTCNVIVTCVPDMYYCYLHFPSAAFTGEDTGDCFFVERYESDVEEEGGASTPNHSPKKAAKREKQLMLVISDRFLEEKSSMGDQVSHTPLNLVTNLTLYEPLAVPLT